MPMGTCSPVWEEWELGLDSDTMPQSKAFGSLSHAAVGIATSNLIADVLPGRRRVEEFGEGRFRNEKVLVHLTAAELDLQHPFGWLVSN